MTDTSEGPLLSFKEAGKIAKLDPRTVAAGVKAGEIPTVRIAGRAWIPREAFARFIAGDLAQAR